MAKMGKAFACTSDRTTIPDGDTYPYASSWASDLDGHPPGDRFERRYHVRRPFVNRWYHESIDLTDDRERVEQGASTFDIDEFLASPCPIGASGNVVDMFAEDATVEACDQRDSFADFGIRHMRFIIDPHEVQEVQEVHETLCIGNFSEVYRCSIKGPDDQIVEVALKLYGHHIRLEDTESTLLSELEHPNLVRLHVALDGTPVSPTSSWVPCGLALELCVGGTLEHFLHGPGQPENLQDYDIRARVRAAEGVVSALCYLHGLGIVHRDVNPGNCFLTQKAQNGVVPPLKLGNLHYARQVTDGPMTRLRGTFAYMAPEVVESNMYNASADIFSFGILLHELLSGEVPFNDLVGKNETSLMSAIVGGTRPSLDVFSRCTACAEIRSVIGSCWELSAYRISADALTEHIQHLSSVA